MESLLLLVGRLAGLAGLLSCLVAGISRLQDKFYLGGFQLTTLLHLGVALVVVGCFFLLLALTARSRR